MVVDDFNAGLETEIARTAGLARRALGDYAAWGSQVCWGEVGLVTHGEIIDFVNFRMESAETCLDLIESGKVGDALGLCRSLLENYLLLMLICRGDKYFRLLDFSHKSPGEFAKIFAEGKQSWQQKRAVGETICVAFEKYPRTARTIMLVYDRIAFDDGEKLPVSMYYFHFEQFRPDVMRLDPAKYFEYYATPKDLREAIKGHRRQATHSYQHYLGYDALVMGLELNGIVDEAARRRLEAHYTFLGTFLHPTHHAMRNLRVRSNWHTHRTMVGMERPYTQVARLLANAYVCYLVAGYLDEFARLFETASAEYVRDPKTQHLRTSVEDVEDTIPYFWFLFNEAPTYDKFNWASHRATDEQLADVAGYEELSTDLIPFQADVYENLRRGLLSWSNGRVGRYQGPAWMS